MNDPVLLVTILKIVLLLSIIGAAGIVFGEIVPMARGREAQPGQQAPKKGA